MSNGGEFLSSLPNPRQAIPFETEIFKGVVMLAIRTDPIDHQYQSFFQGKKLFEVQVQGKFKRLPRGEFYVGMEATNKMELGIIAKSVSKGVIQFCGTMINGLQQSFGDNQADRDFQYPHLVAPMFNSLDRIIVTSPGETLPPLGSTFIEDPEYRKQRFKFKSLSDSNVNLDNTYSFSVNSGNMDFISWSLIGVPMMRPIDLRPFFGDSSFRLVGYEVPKEVVDLFPNSHPQRLINYIFNFKVIIFILNDVFIV